MTWWNKKEVQEPEVVTGKPGEMIPCDNPETAIIAPETDPEPDLSIKPEDKIGFCFAYVCPKKHIQYPFEKISVDEYKQRRACQKCGAVSKPAIVRRIAEAQWGDLSTPSMFISSKPEWGWYNSYSGWGGRSLNWGDTIWTKYEFINFLDPPKRKVKK